VSPRYHRLPSLEVELDGQSRPALLHWRGSELRVEVCGQWRIDEPWGRPVQRDYFQLRTLDRGTRRDDDERQPQLLLLVFLDRLTGTWHLERLYD
jgi:hypothetical protein